MTNKYKNINVEALIPQKKPFVMVDKLLHFTSTEVEAGLTITNTNIFVKDNIFTEPGLIEHMAQSVALHTGYDYFLKEKPAPVGYIGSIKSINISELPKVSDRLKTKVTIVQEFMNITLVDISVTVNNKVIAYGQMKTVIAEQS